MPRSQIIVLVSTVGGLSIFVTWFAIQFYISDPFLKKQCQNSCLELGLDYEVSMPYVASRSNSRCICRSDLSPQQFTEGYFFFGNQPLDWLFYYCFRIIPISLIVFCGIFGIAKIISRLKD